MDGGQDFRFFNPLSGRVEHDDRYLIAMSDVVQEIQGYQRLMFTIFEDGRPWPEEGWEATSTCRELIEAKSGSFQYRTRSVSKAGCRSPDQVPGV